MSSLREAIRATMSFAPGVNMTEHGDRVIVAHPAHPPIEMRLLEVEQHQAAEVRPDGELSQKT